jgi:hypothetical protein
MARSAKLFQSTLRMPAVFEGREHVVPPALVEEADPSQVRAMRTSELVAGDLRNGGGSNTGPASRMSIRLKATITSAAKPAATTGARRSASRAASRRGSHPVRTLDCQVRG